MAHVVCIEDENGDVVDHTVYCSDFCAQQDEGYDGWSGCIEISSHEDCAGCEEHVCGLDCFENPEEICTNQGE